MQSENQPCAMSDNPSCSKEVEVYEKVEIAVRQLELSHQAITISIDDGSCTWIEALKNLESTKAFGNVLYHMGLIRRFASLFQWNRLNKTLEQIYLRLADCYRKIDMHDDAKALRLRAFNLSQDYRQRNEAQKPATIPDEMNVHASADERAVYLDKCIAVWNDSLMEASEGIRLKEVNDVRAVQLLRGLRDEGLRLHSLPNINEFLTGFQWFSMTYLMERTYQKLGEALLRLGGSSKSEAKESLYMAAVFAGKYVKKPTK